MAVAANKRSIMTLFSDNIDIYSHQVRIVLAEKGVGVEISYIDPTELSEDLLELNPYVGGISRHVVSLLSCSKTAAFLSKT